jgi:integrase
MLFGSGMRVNEVAHLKVSDVFYRDGALKEVFIIRGPTTKTDQHRPGFILARQHREALFAWRDQRVAEGAFISKDGSYGGLEPESDLILGRRGKTWRRLAFNDKKYKTGTGEIVTTKVCGSLENLVRELLKGAGLNYGSSHSGRRTLATWLDRKGYDLELIQLILGHRNPDMTLEYIDPNLPRIKAAFQSIWSGLKAPITNDHLP